jgi:hypothetical protein
MLSMHILGGPQQTFPHNASPLLQHPAASAAHLPPLGQVKTHTHLLLALHVFVPSVPQAFMSVGQQLSAVLTMHLVPHLVSFEQQSPEAMQVPFPQRRWPGQQVVLATQLLSAHLVSLAQQVPGETQVPFPQRRMPGQQVVLATQELSLHLVSLVQHWPVGRQMLPAQAWGWAAGQPQAPALHFWAPGQALLQAPQLLLSLLRLTQRSLHQT